VKEVKNTDEVESMNEGKNRLMQRLGNTLEVGRRDCFIWSMSHCVTERVRHLSILNRKYY
jgi:hypothetical protein